MLETVDGRDLVFSTGERVTVPDGTAINPVGDGRVKLKAPTRGGGTVGCEVTTGQTVAYVRFVLDHMANEIRGHSPDAR